MLVFVDVDGFTESTPPTPTSMQLPPLVFTGSLMVSVLAGNWSPLALGFQNAGTRSAAPEVQVERGIYRVSIEARALLRELQVEARHGRHESGDLIAELSIEQAQRVAGAGFSVSQLFPDRRAEREAGGELAVLAGGTSYAQMRLDFQALAAANPSFVEYHVFGQSVQGRDLFGIKISGNVSMEEVEPELVFWGNIHGDEVASGEVVYDFGKHLVNNYGVLTEVTSWIDTTEIWVIPLVNPDGHELFVRENANGVDLNRDLGFNWDGWGGSPAPFSQPETRALREFLQTGNVTLSSTAHCSGDVIFYPWCYSPHPTPEEGFIKKVGYTYSLAANYVLINSWDDYETHGELLDLVYGDRGALCYTIEMSNSQALYADTWMRNKAGMEALCEVVHRGISGTVTDAQTGAPLWARVWIDHNPYASMTDPVLGDVHRMLDVGTYDVTVWANGYLPKTILGVSVDASGSGTFAVSLERGGNHHAMQITAVNPEDSLNLHNNTTDMPRAIGIPDGKAASLGSSGTITLDFGQPGAIVDGPGVDFTVIEALVEGDSVFESYSVYAGTDPYVQSELVGSGVGTTSFDLGVTSLSSAQYLRIQDTSGAPPADALAGVELDAVTILNGPGSPALAADVAQISIATGGVQNFTLIGPSPGATYLLLGTTNSTSVGQQLPGTWSILPLNPGPYFLLSLTSPTTFLSNSFGILDGQGMATAALNVPLGLGVALVGLHLDHGYATFDPATWKSTFVSNTVGLDLIP